MNVGVLVFVFGGYLTGAIDGFIVSGAFSVGAIVVGSSVGYSVSVGKPVVGACISSRLQRTFYEAAEREASSEHRQAIRTIVGTTVGTFVSFVGVRLGVKVGNVVGMNVGNAVSPGGGVFGQD